MDSCPPMDGQSTLSAMDDLPDCLLVDILRRLPCDGNAFRHALVCRKWLQASLLAQQSVRSKAGAGMHGRILVDQLSKFSCLTSLTLEPGSVAVGHVSGVLLNLIALKLPALRELQVLGPDTIWGSTSASGLSSLFGNAERLESLTLQGRGSPALHVPETLERLAGLKQLRLCLDHLVRLPEALGRLGPSLELLAVKSDSIVELPAAVGSLHSLRRLEVASRSLQQLPDSLCSLTGLEELSLAGCSSLELLPESLGSLRALTSLKANNLHSLLRLPGSLTDLLELRTLSVRGCRRLSALPYGMHGLSSLEALHVEECANLRRFPDPLYRLPCLRTFSAGENLSGFLAGSHMLSFPSRLRRVSVSFLAAQALPGSLCSSLPGLEELQVSRCQFLEDLPPDIGTLERLRKLKIEDCPLIATLPASLTAIKGLEAISVSGCKLFRALPEAMEQLSRLRSLELTTLPSFTALPLSLIQLHGLKRLTLPSLLSVADMPVEFQAFIVNVQKGTLVGCS